MKIIMSFIFILSFAVSAQAQIVSKEIEYVAGGVTMNGHLSFDNSILKKRPGILVVHEWWCHNNHARVKARMLAAMGYTALAVDMYGEGKIADHPKKAGELMNAAFKNWDASKLRFEKAIDIIKSHKTVDSNRIASIGYCFGGAVSLRMAREGVDLDGVAAFHSALPLEPKIQKGAVKTAIMVANGSEDAFLKPETVSTFTGEMMSAGVDMVYINLRGIRHSYTNPQADEFSKKFNIPNLAYDKTADRRTWVALQRFFDRIFAEK